jgi:site-specific DNA-methyltransferase (adenine-specific)
LRDIHEYILVFSKGTFTRKKPPSRNSTISREEFLELTKSVWTFPAEQARSIGHPAPFPVELPYRLTQLYTYEGDVVLDPFMGSGQAAIAAIKTKRHYVGYEINEEYVKLAERRIRRFSYVQNVPALFDFIVKEGTADIAIDEQLEAKKLRKTKYEISHKRTGRKRKGSQGGV